MRFHVGPWVYRVRITENRLYDENGAELAGLFVWRDREILISNAVPVRQRLDVLVHELRHAWREHFGAGENIEGECNNVASFTASIMRQLLRQGGEPTLMRLDCNGMVNHAAKLNIASERLGAECMVCGRRFSPIQVSCETAQFDTAAGRLAVARWLFCDFCGHVQRWHELATTSGLPTGEVLDAPELLKGKAAQRFLSEHPLQFQDLG